MEKKIDVLAVMDFLADEAAHAAVAELIEAASELKEVCNRPSAARTRAESWRRLDRALARVRSS